MKRLIVVNIFRRNQFYLQEVIEDSTTSPIACGLRVAVVFLSRQAPGVTNVLWGIHERLKLVKGRCFGFYSKDGLFTQRYIEITDKVGGLSSFLVSTLFCIGFRNAP
jgi:hypothetical protein